MVFRNFAGCAQFAFKPLLFKFIETAMSVKQIKVAIILAGCGVKDGSEIHESTMLMLALSQQNIAYDCFAPDLPQHDVVNHLSGETMAETRNMLVEAARIARGSIRALSELQLEEYRAICIPGGFGVAKNLCDYAQTGKNLQILPQLQELLTQAHAKKIPLLALCIAPVILAKLVTGAQITIGQDEQVAQDIRDLGGEAVLCGEHEGVIIDEKNLFFTTPCYMLEANIAQIYAGVASLVKALVPYL